MHIIKRIKAFFILLEADRELGRAVRQADRMYLKTGRRHYVLPDARHRLGVYSWADIKRMRRDGLFSNRATQDDFLFESFYYTSGQFGEDKLPQQCCRQKRRAWLNYVAQVRCLV